MSDEKITGKVLPRKGEPTDKLKPPMDLATLWKLGKDSPTLVLVLAFLGAPAGQEALRNLTSLEVRWEYIAAGVVIYFVARWARDVRRSLAEGAKTMKQLRADVDELQQDKKKREAAELDARLRKAGLAPAVLLLSLMLAGCAWFQSTAPAYIEADNELVNAIAPIARGYLAANQHVTPLLYNERRAALDAWQADVATAAVDPDKHFGAEYVKQERAHYNAIAPWYQAYVKADPGLTDDDRQSSLDTLQAWELLIRQAENELASKRGPPDG